MDKILTALGELKAYFAGIKDTLAKLTTAEERVKSLEAELAAANASRSEFEVKIKQSQTDLEKAQNEVNAKGTEIKNLQAQLEAAQRKAEEVIAAQGLPADQVPPSKPATPQGTLPANATATERCLAAKRKTSAQ